MKREPVTSVSLPLTIGILSVFFLSMSLGSITPATNKMVEFYGSQGIPMTAVMYVTSLPQLISVVGSFVAGAIAGKVLPFKTCAVIGILMILCGGVAPFFLPQFAALLTLRMVFGAGFGFIMVLGNPLVSAFFTGSTKTKILSISTFVTFGGAVVMQSLCGVLADMGLQYAHLTHLVAVVPLVLAAALLKEPAGQRGGRQTAARREPIPPRVFYVAAVFGLITMFVMPAYINLSIFVSPISPYSTVAAVVQVLYSVGNMFGGLCFMIQYRYCKRYSMGVSCLIMCAGLVMMLTASTLPVMCGAMLVAGFGYGGLMPASLMITGAVTKPSQTALATSIVFIGMNVLGFLATPFAGIIGSITGDALTAPVLTGTAAIFVIGIVIMVAKPFPAEQNRESGSEQTSGTLDHVYGGKEGSET